MFQFAKIIKTKQFPSNSLTYRKTSKWSKPEFKFNTVTLFLTT